MDNVPVVHGFSQRIDPASLYSIAQVEAIQAAACVIAGISLLGSLVAIYWFTRMKKKFRHKYDFRSSCYQRNRLTIWPV